jgi:hypothetical protein
MLPPTNNLICSSLFLEAVAWHHTSKSRAKAQRMAGASTFCSQNLLLVWAAKMHQMMKIRISGQSSNGMV